MYRIINKFRTTSY